MTIPKIIHYCWFGNDKMPNKYREYIYKWHKKCPDYTFIRWSEKNFNYNDFLFTKEAYDQGNFAFLSDYVRLYALQKLGGIYLDVDVELLKPIDSLLFNDLFVGMENWSSINSGLILGSHPNDKNINNMIKIYDEIAYKNNKLDENDNTVLLFTSYFHKLGFKYRNKKQKINGCTIYPTDYFCPKSRITNRLHISENTYAIHHYNDSWSGKIRNNNINFNILLGDLIKRILRPKLYLYLYNKYLNIKMKIKNN